MSRDARILRSASWHGPAVAVGRPSKAAAYQDAGHKSQQVVERTAPVAPPLVRDEPGALTGGPARPQLSPPSAAPAVDVAVLEATSREQGRRAGYEEGLQEGRRLLEEAVEARARALAQDQVAEQVAEQLKGVREQAAQAAQQQRQSQAQETARRAQQVEELAEQLSAQWSQLLQGAEDDMLDVVFEAVCRIVGDQAVTREGARAMLARTLQSWHGRHPLSVHLHPDDMELLRADADTVQALASRGFDAERQSLRWVADTGVRAGGCLLRSAEGALDARLERQLEAMATRLAEIRAARRQGPTGAQAGEAAA